ncbi:ABC transporter substrate-binding protein [Sphaerobacter thermophilus]|uniref:ABC transporter substrate-binding protein n=1 Tax=Sphaerobacter thermophilus TaxID=2057 RepID=UPI0039C36EBD
MDHERATQGIGGEKALDGRLSRRRLLRLFAAGAAVPAISLLAACGEASVSDDGGGGGQAAPTATTSGSGAPSGGSPAASPSSQGSTTPSGPVRIGVILPLSGVAASVGADEKAAVELAVKIVNEETPDLPLPLAATAGLPNLGGATVELVFADSQGKAEVGQSEAERLINQENVVALFGCYQSAVTKTASAVAERAGIPFMNGESSSPALTESGYQWFFRTSPHDGDFSKAIMAFIRAMADEKGADVSTVSLLYEDTDFGVNSAKALTDEAEAHGLQIVGEVKYKANTTALTSEVQALRSQGADVLCPASYTNDAILTIETARQQGYLPKMIVAQDAGYSDPAFIEGVGAAFAEGIATRSAFSIDITEIKPAAAKVNEMYREIAGKDMHDVPARGFTAMMVLLDAINRAGSTEPDAIREALEATDLGPDDTIMPWQGVRFDETHQNILGGGIIVQIQNGEYRTVYPFDVATVEPSYPLQPWDQRGA